MRVTGAVLCGGASRRMGADKATLDVHGTPMARLVADALLAAGCEPVMAIGGDPQVGPVTGLPVVADEHPGEGPLGGLTTALAAAAAGVDAVFVVACDLPALQPSTVQRILEQLGAHDAAIAWTDRMEPLCAVWRVGVLPVLRAEFDRGRRAVHEVVEGLDVEFVQVEPAALRNVNTPVDLDQLR